MSSVCGMAERTRRNPLLAAVGIVLALISSCSKDANTEGATPAQALPVKVQVAQLVLINDTTEYVATLKSRDSSVIMPQVEGQITKIYVHSGDRVSEGSKLLEIDPSK